MKIARLMVKEMDLLENVSLWNPELGQDRILFENIIACPIGMPKIKEAQEQDKTLRKRRYKALKGELPGYSIDSEGILRYQDRVYLPRNSEIKDEVLREAHCSRFTVHPGSNKMYRDLKQKFCCDNMKRKIAQYVSKFLTCQQVKAEQQKPSGLH